MFASIKNKKILITGASSGIGRCTAELLASYGAVCGVHYCNNEDGAKAVVDSIRSQGGVSEIFKEDLSVNVSHSKLIQSFVNTYGKIDILVNNAGGIFGKIDFLRLDEESWNKTYHLNVTAPFFLAQKAIPHMKECNGGKIINISSISAKYGGTNVSLHYGSAKSALETVTIGLAKLCAKDRILVNSIRCGFIDTGFHAKIKWSKEEILERIKQIPLGRSGKPIDISRLILFLASEAGNHITGENFTVSGGD